MRWILRHVRLIGVIGVLLGVLAYSMRSTPATVDVATAAIGPMRVTIDDEGETRVRERFAISAPVAGALARIDLEPGDAVTRGTTVLARIAPGPAALIDARSRAELAAAVEAAQATVGQARAERQRADAALTRLRSSLARVEGLIDVGAVSRDELEQARTNVRTAEEALRASEFSVSRAEYDLQVARARLVEPAAAGGRVVSIVAPIDGVVLKRFRESAAIVPVGEPLLEIGNPANLEVVADLLSTEAVRIAPGQAVLVENWGGGEVLPAHVRRVEPAGFTKVSALGVDEQRVNVIIDFDDSAVASQSLGDAYRVEVRIVVWEGTSVLRVPIGALFRRGEDWAVFVFDGDRVTERRVEIGQRNSMEAEVRNGLSEGDRIVVHPPDTLSSGVRAVVRSS